MKKYIFGVLGVLIGIVFLMPQGYAARDNITAQGIIVYTVLKGDTYEKIARKYSISLTNLYKENNITADTILYAGSTLQIAPEQGVAIILEKNMTIPQIAKQFSVSVTDLTISNNFVGNETLVKGTEVFIPRGEKDVVASLAKPQVIVTRSGGQRVNLAEISQQTANAYLSTIFTESFGVTDITQNKGTILATWFQKGQGFFGFVAGHCTDYAASRRPDIFQVGKGFRGNAKDWAQNAKNAGYEIGTIPKKHAIAVFAAGRGGDPVYGHVAYVEQIDIKNNLMIISEMNYLGRNIVTKRVVDSRLPVAFIY